MRGKIYRKMNVLILRDKLRFMNNNNEITSIDLIKYRNEFIQLLKNRQKKFYIKHTKYFQRYIYKDEDGKLYYVFKYQTFKMPK